MTRPVLTPLKTMSSKPARRVKLISFSGVRGVVYNKKVQDKTIVNSDYYLG